jgi:hypothetical protein
MKVRLSGRSRAFAVAAVAASIVALGACTGGNVSNKPAVIEGATKEPAAGLAGFNIYRPTNLAAVSRPMPVIAWINGGCVAYDQPWDALLSRWAKAGYLVVSPGVPGSTQPTNVSYSTQADQKKAIDWAFGQNASGPLAGKLDLTRVVASGNSCGGITSLHLAGEDPRITNVFVLSGSSIGPGASRAQAATVMNKVKVPVGFVTGGPGDVSRAQVNQDFDLLGAGLKGFVALRSTGDHVTVSTTVSILAEVSEISLNWFDHTLYGSASAGQALTIKPCGTCAANLYTVKTKAFS